MTREEHQRFNRLHHRMMTEGDSPTPGYQPEGRRAGFVPELCLKGGYFKGAGTTAFMELIIWKKAPDGKIHYLYQNRWDEWWQGFCAFGGMIRSGFPETLVDIAKRQMKAEFQNLGVGLKSLRVVSAINWQSHPWANPFAVVCLIELDGEVAEVGDRVWLSLDNLPENMVINHGSYLAQCEHFLNHGALVFTEENPFGVPGLRPVTPTYAAPPPKKAA